MNSPKCKCEKRVKSGIVKRRQRYKNKGCCCNYTVELKSTVKTIKKQALHLYLEGLGFSSIGRFLVVSNVSVLNWICSFGKNVYS